MKAPSGFTMTVFAGTTHRASGLDGVIDRDCRAPDRQGVTRLVQAEQHLTGVLCSSTLANSTAALTAVRQTTRTIRRKIRIQLRVGIGAPR